MIIRVTDLGGRTRLFDSDTVTGLRAVPDTIVTFLDGRSMIVREPVRELVSQIHGENRRSRVPRPERKTA